MEENKYCTCLSVVLLVCVVKIDNDYYTHILLEECKYTVKKRKIIKVTNN